MKDDENDSLNSDDKNYRTMNGASQEKLNTSNRRLLYKKCIKQHPANLV